MPATGRKLSPIWDSFKKIVVPERKGCRAECRFCSKIIEGQVKRLEAHLKCCKNNELDADEETAQPNGEVIKYML